MEATESRALTSEGVAYESIEIRRPPSFFQLLSRQRSALVGTFIIFLLVVFAIFGPLLAPYDPIDQNFREQLLPPGRTHLLGTDEFGRDTLSRLLYGSRTALMVGILTNSIGLSLGVALGLIAGYGGRWVGVLIMRFIDIMLAFPYLLLAMMVVAVLGPSLTNAMIAIGVVYMPQYARLVRASVLSVKETDYVMAARAVGASPIRIAFLHVLRNCIAPIIVMATLAVGWAIVETAGLSFLGLGAQPPRPEWGAMLSRGRTYMLSAYWLAVCPGVAIFVTVVGFNLLGDGLRDALDPYMRGRG